MISQPFKIASNISIPGSVLNKLTVSGNVSSTRVIYASGGNSDLWNSTYATVSSLSANNILAGGNSKGTDIIIGTNDNYALKLETAGTTKMTVTSAGFVGIGNTDPASILEINDSTAGQKDVTFTLRNGNFGWWRMTSSNTNTAGFLRFASGNSAFTPLTLDATTGNVGITNNTPAARLDIADTTLAGSGGLAGSVLNLTQTWSTSGSPTAIKLNVTKTSSNAASKLIDLQVNGVSSLSQSVSGLLRVGGVGFSNSYGIVTEGGISVGSGASFIAGSQLNVYNSGANICSLNTGGIQTTSTGRISWGTGASIASPKLYLACDDTGILAQRDGFNPQQSRIYGTYTSTTDFERLALKYNGSVYQIGTEKGSGGGVAKPLQFYTDSIVRMVIPITGSITVRDETGTQQRLINNFTCLNNSYADGSPAATPWILDAATNNILHNYSTRLTLSSSGSFAASGVFTHQIDWPLSELTNVNGMTYADGIVIVRCYYLSNAASVRVRFWNNFSSIWSAWATAIDITNDPQWGVWRASIGGNYMTKLQVETTSPPGNATSTQSIEYYPTRSNGGIRYPHRYATQGGDKLLFGGGKSIHAAIVGSGNTLKIRRGDDSADGSITAAAGTFSTNLTVSNTISSNNVIYAFGGNSNLWNSAYTSVNANSANGANTYTTVNANSANWSSVYSTVCATSANYILDGGNTKGSNITIGTNDNYAVNLETAGINRMTITTDGNVGIGTINPSAKLDIISLSAYTGTMQSWIASANSNYNLKLNMLNPGAVTYSFDITNAGTVYSNNLVLDRGNVGIGTTNFTDAYVAGTGNLFTSGNIKFGGVLRSASSSFTFRPTYDNTALVFAAATHSLLMTSGNGSQPIIFGANDTTDSLALYAGGAEKIRVTTAGNVGIGTTTPSEKLTVTGNISANGTLNVTATNHSDGIGINGSNATTGIGMRIINTTASGSEWWLFSSGASYAPGVGGFGLWNNTTSRYALWSTSAGVVTFDNGLRIPTQSSYFGVGTYGTVSETNGGLAYITGNNIKASTTVNNQVEKVTSGANPAQFIRMRYDQGISLHTGVGAGDSAGTNYADDINSRLIVNLTGNVGIGTTTPSEKLTVAGTISSNNVIYASGGNSNLWNQNTSALYQATSGQFAVKNANNYFSASQSLTGDLTVKGIISIDKGDGTPLQEVSTKNFSIAMAIALS